MVVGGAQSRLADGLDALGTHADAWGNLGDFSYLPVMRSDQLGGVLQVLLKAQFKSLTNGADYLLGQTLRALQDMASW